MKEKSVFACFCFWLVKQSLPLPLNWEERYKHESIGLAWPLSKLEIRRKSFFSNIK